MTSALPQYVILKNGLKVLIREVREDDGPKLIEMFESLSDETKYTRFMKYRKSLDLDDLKPFLHSDSKNLAIVAELFKNVHSIIIADGRYVLDEPPHGANVGIVVRDDYQRLGLATQMLSIMIDIAKENGIKYFHGEILLENSKMLNFIHKTGYKYEYHDERGVRFFNIDLEQIKTPLSI